MVFYKVFQKEREGKIMADVTCVVCEGTVSVASDVLEGELLLCPDCGTELEVVGISPLQVAEAPEVQEDWGE
jgi:alpha-aminoadipate carrier protein LysW